MEHIKILSLFAIGLVVTACSSKDDYSALDDKTIKLNYTLDQLSVGTRVGISGTEFITTKLPVGEKVGIYFCEAGTSNSVLNESNCCYWDYTIGENNTLTTVTSPTWGNTNLDIIAVYPYTKTIDDTGEEQGVLTNQSTIYDYNINDLLVATASNKTKTDGPITLTFTHALSKINVNILQGISGATLTNIKDIYIYATVNYDFKIIPLSTTSAKATSESPSPILLGDFNADGVTGIVPPQTISASSPFITFKIGTVGYSYTPESSIVLKGGYEYTFNITIVNNEVKASNYTVSSWKTDDPNCTQLGNATY